MVPIFIFVILAVVGIFVINAERKRNAKIGSLYSKVVEKNTNNTNKNLSRASVALLTLFDALPTENRPFGRSELVDTLEALDFKYTVAGVNNHFRVRETSYHVRFNSCTCLSFGSNSRSCRMPEYDEFYKSFSVVKQAIAKRERVLAEAKHQAEVAGRQVDLDRVSQLTQRLRDEAGVLNEVANELSSNS